MRRPTFITWDQLKVGSLILAAIATLTVAVIKLGQAANLFGRRYELIIFLPNANGLLVGGSVMIAGQLAGTVSKIEFLPPDADTLRNLRVELAVDRDLQSQIRRDSKAKIRTMGLLGDKIVDITPGTPSYRALQTGDTIPVQQSIDYEAVIAQASGAVTELVGLTGDLRQITGRLVRGEGTAGQILTNRALYDNLNGSLRRADALLASLQNPNGTLGHMLNDPTLYRNLTHTIASVDSLVISVNSSEGTLGKLLRDDSLYVHFVGVAAGADSLVRAMSRGNGTIGKFVNDQALYDQLVKLVTDLSAVLADVRRDPTRYTKGLIKVF